MAEKKNILTYAGLKQYEDELQNLKVFRRKEVALLKNAEVVVEDEIDLEKISVGCQVKVLEMDEDEEMEFRIVGSTEANSLQNKISNESPVGHALLGKKVGDVVDDETQVGVIQYKVLEIQRVS